MTNTQSNKALILEYYKALDKATGKEINDTIEQYTADNYHWRGMHPFYEQNSANAVADVFWKPFRQSFTSIQRRQDVFMAGLNDVDSGQSEWVCSMGHMMGLFDQSWLGIPTAPANGRRIYHTWS
jgi:hypothetical protein